MIIVSMIWYESVDHVNNDSIMIIMKYILIGDTNNPRSNLVNDLTQLRSDQTSRSIDDERQAYFLIY
jgi:hypothetical protein